MPNGYHGFLLSDEFEPDTPPEEVLAVLLAELERPIHSLHGIEGIRKVGDNAINDIYERDMIAKNIAELSRLIEIGRTYLKNRN